MRIAASADEERGEGQGGPVEEVVEPVAKIDGGELGRQARQHAPRAAGAREVQAKGADQMAVNRLDDLTPAAMLATGRGSRRAAPAGRYSTAVITKFCCASRHSTVVV